MTATSFATPVQLEHAYRLLNHGPTVLLSSAHGGRRNVMAAAWNMPLDFSPPRLAVVIDKSTLTRELVEASGSFALNLPPQALADLCLAEVVAAWADQRVFTGGRWRPLDEIEPALRSLHHLGGGQFVVPGQSLQAVAPARS